MSSDWQYWYRNYIQKYPRLKSLIGGAVVKRDEPVVDQLEQFVREREKCSICLEDQGFPLAVMTNCDHVFHLLCVLELLKKGHNRCPECRKEIFGIEPFVKGRVTDLTEQEIPRTHELFLFALSRDPIAMIGLEAVALALITAFGEYLHPDRVDSKGNTALILACKKGLAEVALSLIERFGDKVRPDHANLMGDTALIWSCSKGMSEIALKLIERFEGASRPEQVNSTGETAFMLACLKGLNMVALRLIEKFDAMILPSQTSKYGQTALIVACEKGLSDVALALIERFERGVRPEQVNSTGTLL